MDTSILFFISALVAESAPPTADGLTAAEYGLYGGIATIILALLFLALRGKGRAPAAPMPVSDAGTPSATIDVESEARRAFKPPQVLVPGEAPPEVAAPPLRTLEPVPTFELPPASEAPASQGPAPVLQPVLAPRLVAQPEPGPVSAPAARVAPTPVAVPAPELPVAKPAPAKPAAVPAKPAAVPAKPAAVPAKPVAVPAKPVAVPTKPAPVPLAAEESGKTLREGLARTHDGFVRKLGQLFGAAKAIDDSLLGELEEALFTADIGVKTSQKLVEQVHESLSRKALLDPEKVWGGIKDKIRSMLLVDAPPLDYGKGKPFVIMVVGVNGSGKTTTVGKLANQYVQQGKRVVLAAGDTFRAAAVEQLAVWGDRAGVPVIRGRDGQDPSSVIFEACKQAADEGYDVCICDTAGRLQAKKELMDELGKVHRVIGKAVAGAPHEVWLVLDATNGQNAISQAKEFAQVVQVTGIVMTKLDGTAKGGVVIGICDEMKLPVRFIGIGERVSDLQAFDADAFAEALLSDE